MAGSPFTFTAASSFGSPIASLAVTAGALPAGLTLDPATGVISGTPTTTGPFSFTLAATNSSGTVTASYTGTVTAATLAATGLDATLLLILATVLTLAGGALLHRRRAVATHPG